MTTSKTSSFASLINRIPKILSKPSTKAKHNSKPRTPAWVDSIVKSYGILLMAIAFLALWTLGCILITKHNTTVKVTAKLTAEYEAQMESYQRSWEAYKQAEPLMGDAPRQNTIKDMATIMAKSFYGHRNVVTSNNDYYTIGWVELFRVASGGEFAYQDTLEAVISQPNAFMGYSEDNPVIEAHFKIAKEICTDYLDGNWPTTEKFVYFDWSQGKVIARNEFATSATTEYWWYGK